MSLQAAPATTRLTAAKGEDIVIYLGALGANVELSMDRARVQHAEPESGNPLSFDDDADSGVGIDTLMNIENVKGTHGDDTITVMRMRTCLKALTAPIRSTVSPATTRFFRTVRRAWMLWGCRKRIRLADDDPDDTGDTLDGLDVVDGGDEGDDGDTISYEGESEECDR